MAYHVVLLRPVKKQLDDLPTLARDRVARALAGLADDPRPGGCVKLTGLDAYRVRVGDYRIIYQIDDAAHEVIVVRIGPRRDVYRGN